MLQLDLRSGCFITIWMVFLSALARAEEPRPRTPAVSLLGEGSGGTTESRPPVSADPNAPAAVPDELYDWMRGHWEARDKEEKYGGRTTEGEVVAPFWQLKGEPRTWVPVYIRNKDLQEKGERQYYLAGPPRSDWLAAICDAYAYTDDAGKNSVELRFDRYGEVKRHLLESEDFADRKKPVKLTRPHGRRVVDELLPAVWESVARIPLLVEADWYNHREAGNKGALIKILRQLAITGDPADARKKVDQVFFPIVVRSIDGSWTNEGYTAWTRNGRPRYWGYDKIMDQKYEDIDPRVQGEFDDLVRYKTELKSLYDGKVELFRKHIDNARWIHDWLVEYVKHSPDPMCATARTGCERMHALMKEKGVTWGQAMETVEKELKVSPPGKDGICTPYRHWLEYFRGIDLWKRRYVRAVKDGLLKAEEAKPDWLSGKTP
jgi:hypothetical protein